MTDCGFTFTFFGYVAIFLLISQSTVMAATSEDAVDTCDAKNADTGACKDKSHDQEQKHTAYSSLENLRLTRLETGDNRTILLPEGREVTLHTVNANKPPIFILDDFLSSKECDYLISTAKEIGLSESQTMESGSSEASRFSLMDMDRDGKMTVDEMRLTIENSFDVYMDNADVQKLIDQLNQDPDGDGFITRDELTATPMILKTYLDEFLKENPEMHSRYSKQVWVYPDTSKDVVFKGIQQKVSVVTQLPLELMRMSDFQIVNYGVKGHYNAHHDSGFLNKEQPCCDKNRKMACRLCRYMTILFYLNDVEGGGATAFPIANNDTYNYSLLREKNLVNLRTKCSEAPIKVSPRKGRAIIWYNHLVGDNGWLGDMDQYTLHGGCPITAGEKWIANFWIKVTDNRDDDLKTMRAMT